MSRAIRIFLVLLLAAALPVRGAAAATMLYCAQGGNTALADHGAQHAMTGEDHTMHDTDPHASNHAPWSETVTVHDTSQGQDENHHASCNTSGACCTGVAAGPLLTPPATLAPLARPIPFRMPLYAGVDLDHAERPPLA